MVVSSSKGLSFYNNNYSSLGSDGKYLRCVVEMRGNTVFRQSKRIWSVFAILIVCMVVKITVFGDRSGLKTHFLMKKPGIAAPGIAAPKHLKTWGVTRTQLSRNTEPMALSLNYWEQVGNAAKNLFDLQCWASSVGIRSVVEPSVNPTLDKTVLKFLKDKKYLKFRDLYDITHWNLMSSNLNFSQLVSLEYFLKHGSKDVVLVQIIYTLYSFRCQPLKEFANRDWFRFLSKNGFHIKKTVCIDFKKEKSHFFKEETFRDKIFRGTGHNISIIFNVWEGVRTSGIKRVAIRGSECNNDLAHVDIASPQPISKITYSPLTSCPNMPSRRLLNFLEIFKTKHLFGAKYVAVMLRTQKMNQSIIAIQPESNSCISKIKLDWKKIVADHNLTQTLFFTDVGKFGSLTWNSKSANKFSQYLQDLLKIKMTLNKVNSALTEITGSTDRVQIALLNRLLVAHAECVIIVGGGNFQMQTLNMYAHLHVGRECYSVRNIDCVPRYIKHVNGAIIDKM